MMPRSRKLLVLLLVLAPLLFCGYKIGFYGLQLYLDRTPAKLSDLPVYPSARDVRYIACADLSLANCSTLAYSTDAPVSSVHGLYEEYLRGDSPLPKRLWLGDGTYYPSTTIVNFYHKAKGHFQVLTLTTLHSPDGTEVTIVLYDH